MMAEACSRTFLDPPQSCMTAADCTAPPGPGNSTAPVCVDGQCSVDACHVDADCGDIGVCSCKGNTFAWSHSSFGNVCITGNCRTNADCSSGACEPSIAFGSGPFYGIEGYYCRTPDDSCECDADCSATGYCAFDPSVSHWACGYTHIAG
jgi:hypothetical protein